MARTAILKVDILSEFNDKGFNKSQSALAKFGKVAKVAAAAAGVALVAGAAKAVNAASALEESTNAVGKVFDTSADQIIAFGKTAANTVGLSRREFQQLATKTGGLLTNFGYSTDDAATATINLGKRAAEMASVFDTDVSTALDAINSGLRGEREPLLQFSVALNDAKLKAKALEMGLYEGTGVLEENAKAQAAYALIMEQTAKTQGDLEDTSGSLANVQRRIGASFEDIAATVGAALLPAVEKVAVWIADVLIPALRSAAEWLRDNLGPAIETVRGFFTNLGGTVQGTGGVFSDVVAWIREKWSELAPKFQQWFTKISEIVAGAAELIRAIIERVTQVVTWIWDNFGDEILAVASFVWDNIVAVIDVALTHIGNIIDFFTALFKGDWEGVGRAIMAIWSNLWNFVTNLLGRAIRTTLTVMSSLVGKARAVMQRVWTNVVNAVRSGISNVLAAVRAMPGRIVSALSGLASRMWNVGREMILGMVRGIMNYASYLVNRVRSVISNAIGAAKRLLGISSPSKVFTDIGMQVAAGMAAGITAGAQSLVAPAVAGMVPTSGTSASSLKGRSLGVTVNGTTNPQQTARELASMISGARVRTGYAGLAA